MNFISRSNILVLLISTIHFIITFFGKIPFNNSDYFFHLKFAFFKAISFLLILIFWYFFLFIVKKIKLKDEKWIRISKFFGIYFGISMILLIITWPGIWVWDEFNILHVSSYLEFLYWQNYLSSVTYILSMMIIPFPAGIVICQLFLISVIITFIIEVSAIKSIWIYFIILLLPPIIISNLTPIRATLFAYLLLFTVFYFYYFLNKLETLRIVDFIPLFITVPIIVIWKSEGIVLFPFILFMLYWVSKNKMPWKKLWIVFGVLLLLIFIVRKPQNDWSEKEYVISNEYKMTVMLNPLSMMLQEKKLNRLEELKPQLSKYIDLDVLKKYPDYKENKAFWNDKEKLFVSAKNEDFDTFKNAFIALIKANPVVFLKYRWQTFEVTAGFINDPSRRNRNADRLVNNSDVIPIKNFVHNNQLNKVLFPNIRTPLVNLLEGSSINNKEESTFIFHVTWNIIFILILLLGITLFSMFKRDVLLFFISSMLWCLTIGIFLTAPASYFMYYFPVYLVTILLFFSLILKKRIAKH